MKGFFLAAIIAAASAAALPSGGDQHGQNDKNSQGGQSDWHAWGSTSTPAPAPTTATPAKNTDWEVVTCPPAQTITKISTAPAPPAVTTTITQSAKPPPPVTITSVVTESAKPPPPPVTITSVVTESAKPPPPVTITSIITESAKPQPPQTVTVTSVQPCGTTTASSGWGDWKSTPAATTTQAPSATWGMWDGQGTGKPGDKDKSGDNKAHDQNHGEIKDGGKP